MENDLRIQRERILSLLYEVEIKGEPVEAILLALPAKPVQFVTDTVLGVGAATPELDKEIERYARRWSIERMVAIDRSVLRLGLWELHNRPDLSVAVIISEAVELVKRYSTDESGKFVNGVLSAMAQDIRG